MASWIQDVGHYGEAVSAVLNKVGSRVDSQMALWCNYPRMQQRRNELEGKVKKDTVKLEKEFGSNLNPSDTYYVGVPRLKVVKRGIAHLSCEIDLFYVGCDEEQDPGYRCWYSMLTPKADSFEVPLCLLSALVEAVKKKDLEVEGANIVERGPGYVIYDFRGREWKVPDAFLGFISALAERHKGFEGLLDMYSCRLVEKFAKELPPADSPKLTSGNDFADIISALQQLGFKKAEAEEVARVVSEKFADSSLEEKVKQAIKYSGE
jgi:hypothetical protein